DLGRALAPGAATTPMGALGGKLLNSLFGGNLNGATSALAGHAGIRPASAASLMTFAAPVILSVLGKSVRSGGLSLPSLIGMLTGQKSALAAALPAGFGLDRLLGSAERVAPAMAAAVEPARKSSVLRWLLPLIGVVLAGLLLSRCNANKDARVQTPAPTVTMEVTAAAAAPAAALFFDVGATALPADGATRLAPMVDYLKSHPGAVAVVSGYHDPTGDQAVNDELAKNRAMAVRDALMASGVEESRIDLQKPADTEGGGSTEAARRVEVTIR
ncbi:MAG: OmpA family protein, partial [Steroidobacteraceae bacterium]